LSWAVWVEVAQFVEPVTTSIPSMITILRCMIACFSEHLIAMLLPCTAQKVVAAGQAVYRYWLINPAVAENSVRAAPAACWYSWRMPLGRSCRRMRR
jgi:hypothetical protein